MNMKQVWAVAGGFFLAYLAITLTNKPAVVTQTSEGGAAQVQSADPNQPGGADPNQQQAAAQNVAFQKGFCFPALGADTLSQEASDQALTALAATGAQWVAITPVFYQDAGNASVVTADAQSTPTIESLRHAITKSREVGLKLMLKPVIASKDGTRREDLAPLDPADWATSYNQAIAPYLALAQETGVEMVCLGSSYSRMESTVPWNEIIAATRQVYSGQLTYGASHRTDIGGYKQFGFWKDLDYIGIDAFFPLSTHLVPSTTDLEDGWTAAAGDIEQWWSGQGAGKPVIFTSVGYASVVGGATEPDRPSVANQADPQLQANAYAAYFKQVYRRPWLAGTYWFNWNNPAIAGMDAGANLYAIEGKPAFEVVKTHFAEAR